MKRLFTISLLIMISSSVWAEFMAPDGKTIADTEYRKSVENFGAQLVITNNEDVDPKHWNAPSEGIYFPTIDKIHKGEIITALIGFKGCAQDENGNCQLTYKFKVMRPDGILYVDLPPDKIWYDRPPPDENKPGLSVGYVRLVVEPYDQTGTYKFVADVKDHVSGKLLSLTNTVVVHD